MSKDRKIKGNSAQAPRAGLRKETVKDLKVSETKKKGDVKGGGLQNTRDICSL